MESVRTSFCKAPDIGEELESACPSSADLEFLVLKLVSC